VRRYKRHLERRKHLSAVSVSTYLTAFRRFCDYLVRAGVLKENPGRYVGGNSRPSTHSREYLSPEDVQAIVAAVPQDDLRGTRDYAMILLMLRCALSEIELVRADVRDLFEEDGGNWMTVQGKGRKTKDERVALPSDVTAALSRYLTLRGAHRRRSPLCQCREPDARPAYDHARRPGPRQCKPHGGGRETGETPAGDTVLAPPYRSTADGQERSHSR